MTNEKIPKKFLLTPENQPKSTVNGQPRPYLAHRDTRRATILVKRTVIGPFVNRHTNEEDTITIDIKGVPHIRIPNRKLKAVEKSRILRSARLAGIMPLGYLTNEVQEIEDLGNPISLVFGDGSNKQNEVAGIPGRVIYSQAVSIQPKSESIVHLTHNALSDEKTMRNVAERDAKGKTTMRTSLFETHYVKEGTTFLSTVTIDTPTKDILAVALYALGASSYGAGTNVYGTNIQNEILGMAFTYGEIPITPWSFLNDCKDEQKSPDSMCDSFADKMKKTAGDANFLNREIAGKLQKELAGDRENIEEALKGINSHCGEYMATIFGTK